MYECTSSYQLSCTNKLMYHTVYLKVLCKNEPYSQMSVTFNLMLKIYHSILIMCIWAQTVFSMYIYFVSCRIVKRVPSQYLNENWNILSITYQLFFHTSAYISTINIVALIILWEMSACITTITVISCYNIC